MSPAKPSKPKAVKPATATDVPETPPVQQDSIPAVAEAVQPPPAPATQPAAPAATDLNQPGFPLHPERVWPD